MRQTDKQPEQRKFLENLLEGSPELRTVQEQDFSRIVSDRHADRFDQWLDNARVTPDLKAFADGLQRDGPAVRAALSTQWSNGQVEGQVNQLKLIKREMYGRANFDLLRKRVLLAA